MTNQYWIRRNNQTTGPFSADQIRQMAAAGMLNEADLISDNQVQFKPAGRIGGLFPDREPTTPPTPSPPRTEVSNHTKGLDPAISPETDAGGLQIAPVERGHEKEIIKKEIIAGWISAGSRIIPIPNGVLLTILFFLPWLQINGCDRDRHGYEFSGWQLTVGEVSVPDVSAQGKETRLDTGSKLDTAYDAVGARPRFALALISPLMMAVVSLLVLVRIIKPVHGQRVVLVAACVGAVTVLSALYLDFNPDFRRYYRMGTRRDMEAKGAKDDAILVKLAKVDLRVEREDINFRIRWRNPIWFSLAFYVLAIFLSTASLLAPKWLAMPMTHPQRPG